MRLVEAGADGIVLFNRFYQPDFDLDNLDIVHTLDLSTSAELRLPLRWISIMSGSVDTDFALTSGIHTHKDVIKAMMAGAKVAMMASTLLYNGEQYVGPLLSELEHWMKEHDYDPADAGQHEPESREGTGGIRTGKLYEGSQLLPRFALTT
jgi:dihydroorotate dehydrogenase (fumarate)